MTQRTAGCPCIFRTISLALGLLAGLGLAASVLSVPAAAQTDQDDTREEAVDDAVPHITGQAETPPYLLTIPDAKRGRALFVSKGCVVCHSLNGVGGQVGPPLDPDPYQTYVDPLEFVAGMWRGATAMIVLQEMELGYQIDLTGDDIAHIAGFLHNWDEVQDFNENDVPEFVRRWMDEDAIQRLEEGLIDE